MSDMYGYKGTILRVDLTEGTVQKEPLSEDMARRFLGGRGLADKLIWDYIIEKDIQTGFDPLSPDNIFVDAVGPLTGIAPQGGKGQIQFISPSSGLLGGGGVGGFSNVELKRAGYDALVITGKASEPVYLYINDDDVSIRPAQDLWGRDVFETHLALTEELGEVHTIVIGPAGENLVQISTLMFDGYKSSGGCCGSGAVFGSKNLKAVAIKGTGGVAPADLTAFMEADREYKEAFKVNPMWATNALLVGRTYAVPPDMWILSEPDRIYETGVRYESCWNCFMPCSSYHEKSTGPYATRGYGPEAIGLPEFVWSMGIESLEQANYLDDLMDKLGLEWSYTINTLALAVDLYEQGVITQADTGGIEFKRGDAEVAEQMIRLIANRERIGDLLAEGPCRVPAIVPEAEAYQFDAKGVLLYWDPRNSDLGPAVLSSFAQYRGHGMDWDFLYLCTTWAYLWEYPYGHLSSPEDGTVNYRGLKEEDVKALLLETVGPEDTEKIFAGDPTGWCNLSVRGLNWGEVYESALFCRRIISILDGNMTLSGVPARMLSAVTGEEYTTDQLETLGERVANLQRIINARLGITRKQDKFPDALELAPEVEEQVQEIMDHYYSLRGWSLETGLPSKEKLSELGLEEEAEEFESGGPYEDWAGVPRPATMPKWGS